MTTWEDLVVKAKELAQAAGRKATDVKDLAKMKLAIAKNEHAMEATLEAIGRLYYDSRREGATLDEETVNELFTQMDELTAANADLQASVDANLNKKSCPECHAANPEDAAFCNKCGAKL